MEKRTPTLDLAGIKLAFSKVEQLRLTVTARKTAQELGFSLQDIVDTIQTIDRSHFYKSMTTYASSSVWQDVYHVPARGFQLYVKFMYDETGHLVVSFKEK